jgi:hypothetical protein
MTQVCSFHGQMVYDENTDSYVCPGCEYEIEHDL